MNYINELVAKSASGLRLDTTDIEFIGDNVSITYILVHDEWWWSCKFHAEFKHLSDFLSSINA